MKIGCGDGGVATAKAIVIFTVPRAKWNAGAGVDSRVHSWIGDHVPCLARRIARIQQRVDFTSVRRSIRCEIGHGRVKMGIRRGSVVASGRRIRVLRHHGKSVAVTRHGVRRIIARWVEWVLPAKRTHVVRVGMSNFREIEIERVVIKSTLLIQKITFLRIERVLPEHGGVARLIRNWNALIGSIILHLVRLIRASKWVNTKILLKLG